MALRWILEAVADFTFEMIAEVGAEFLGDHFCKRHGPSNLRAKRRRIPYLKRNAKGYAADEVDHPAEILEKPEPISGSASKSGVVILKAVLWKDGQVKYIHPLKGLGNKETRLAIDAARKIRFHPAQKDGFPVSQWIEIEYRFEGRKQ
jgi:TonB family protein